MVVLEHSLIILLLLVGLLNARPRLPAPARWVVGGALALAFIAPARPVEVPWDWLAALVIPLLLWQAARRLVGARWPADRGDIGLWGLIIVGIGAVLLFTSELALPGALLFGLLAASMTWRATENGNTPTYLGQLGPLALAFLLAEIAPAVEAPDRFALALAGGAGLGAVIGYAGLQVAQPRPEGRRRDAVSIGQVYLAYGIAWLFDLSSVAAAMFAVIVYVAYGTRRGLWPSGVIRPIPLDAGPVFGLAVIALAFFAWQTHVPLTPILLLEVGLGLLVTGIAVGAGRALKSRTFYAERSFLNVIVRVGLLLVPALLLWPRGVLIDPAPLALALLAAGAATLGAHVALTPLLSLYAWLDEAGVDVERPDRAVNMLPIGSLMAREFATARPDVPVPDLTRQLLKSPTGCVLIVETGGRLMGIVTESDLFVKAERLPQSGRTYPALFKEPAVPEQLPDVYARIGSKYVASDVMNSNVVWVKDSQSVSRAIRLMARHGFRRLPVVNADPAAGGQVVGLLTRADIIRWMSDADRTARQAPRD